MLLAIHVLSVEKNRHSPISEENLPDNRHNSTKIEQKNVFANCAERPSSVPNTQVTANPKNSWNQFAKFLFFIAFLLA